MKSRPEGQAPGEVFGGSRSSQMIGTIRVAQGSAAIARNPIANAAAAIGNPVTICNAPIQNAKVAMQNIQTANTRRGDWTAERIESVGAVMVITLGMVRDLILKMRPLHNSPV